MIVKSLFSSALLCLIFSPSFSQIRLPTADQTGTDIKKVIREYPHHFDRLQGSIIEENPQSIQYECNMKVSGSEAASITQYSSKSGKVYSWQALMLTTDDYSKAKDKFRHLFTVFNHLAVRMDYGQTFYLRGVYVEPVEERNFTSAILRFEDPDQLTHKMKLEVTMQYSMMEWKVSVLIYERDREDAEQGDVIE